MDIQDSTGKQQFHTSFTAEHRKENRLFPRYKIKRRILIKDPKGHILTGHAFDISRQGLQFRCSPHIAYHLQTNQGMFHRYNSAIK